MNEKKFEIGEESYKSDMNGWTDFTDVPESKKAITYCNPITKKKQTQTYTENTDILVIPIVRKNAKGIKEFGLIEKEVPATIGAEAGKGKKKGNYEGVLLEVPTIALSTKEIMEKEKITEIIDNGLMNLGLYLEGYSVLDDSKTPISQSFTNQCGQFYVGAVSNTASINENIHWFPIEMLNSFIEMQREAESSEIHSSLQTMYSLLLLNRKYQKEISNMPQVSFKLDKTVGKLKLISEKEQEEHKYRFGINDITYKDKCGNIKMSTYSTSRDSVQCGLISKNKQTGEREIDLSLQLRSPFIADEKFNGNLYEISAGMIEPEQSRIEAAIAEAEQEQACKLTKKDVKHLFGPLLISISTAELTDFFIANADEGENTTQKLDEEEVIGNKTRYNLKELSHKLTELKAPLATKFFIALAQSDFEREKQQRKTEKQKEER